jgi:hypothetical protein
VLGELQQSQNLSRPPGVEVHVEPASSALLVAFSDLRPPLGEQFAFRRVSEALDTSRILVRDHNRCWYHRGVRGVGTDPESVLQCLQGIVSSINPDRVVVTGSSAGGYAAILFGELMSVDEVHAFAPQTFLSSEAIRRFREPRWSVELGWMSEGEKLHEGFGDLAGVVGTGSPRCKPVHHVWFDPSEKPDSVHVAQLRHADRVRLHALPHGDHDIAHMLQRRGDLHRILDCALRAEEPAHIADELSSFTLPRKVPRSYLARRQARITRNRLMVRLGREPIRYY